MTATHHERLSGQDLSLIAIEDGLAHMHVGMVSVIAAAPLRLDDGSLDFDRIVSFVAPNAENRDEHDAIEKAAPTAGVARWNVDPTTGGGLGSGSELLVDLFNRMRGGRHLGDSVRSGASLDEGCRSTASPV